MGPETSVVAPGEGGPHGGPAGRPVKLQEAAWKTETHARSCEAAEEIPREEGVPAESLLSSETQWKCAEQEEGHCIVFHIKFVSVNFVSDLNATFS